MRARPGGSGSATPRSTASMCPISTPPGRRRRVGDDLAAAVVGHAQRPPPHRPVGGQVGHRQPPAGHVLVVDHRRRQAAVVEVARAELGQALDRAGELGLAHALALAHEPPAGGEHLARLGRVLQDDLDRDQHRLLAAGRGDALVGRGRCGHQQVAPRLRPEAAVHGREAGDDAGHRAGGRADVEHLRRLLVERDVDGVGPAEAAIGRQVVPGMVVKASSRCTLPCGGAHQQEAAPHGLIRPGSAAHDIAAAATVASTAFPRPQHRGGRAGCLLMSGCGGRPHAGIVRVTPREVGEAAPAATRGPT